MIQINYPQQPFKIKKEGNNEFIFDTIRKSWIMLSPEEWVRQNILQFLVQTMQYPASLIAVEKSIQLGTLNKRFDILVYQKNKPWMIIECKEANTAITEKTFAQILQYQQVLEAKYLIMSNGHSTMGAKIESGKLRYLQNFPDYDNL